MLVDLEYNNMFTAYSKVRVRPQLESKTHVAQAARDRLQMGNRTRGGERLGPALCRYTASDTHLSWV